MSLSSLLRFGFTTLIFLLIIIRYRKEIKRLSYGIWVMMMLAALLGIVIYLILKEKVAQRTVFGFIAAIIGIMIVISHGSHYSAGRGLWIVSKMIKTKAVVVSAEAVESAK